MVENRGSMAGAACVLAALRYIAETKVYLSILVVRIGFISLHYNVRRSQMPIKVTAVIPICENMISGQCMKVGDVVKTLNGLHVTVRPMKFTTFNFASIGFAEIFEIFRQVSGETSSTPHVHDDVGARAGVNDRTSRCMQIENTDMEGRLMLADALVYGQAVFKPSLVIDVATLTRKPQRASAPRGARARLTVAPRRRRAAGHGRRGVRRLLQLRGGLGRAAPRGRRQRRPALALPALEVLLGPSHQYVRLRFPKTPALGVTYAVVLRFRRNSR